MISQYSLSKLLTVQFSECSLLLTNFSLQPSLSQSPSKVILGNYHPEKLKSGRYLSENGVMQKIYLKKSKNLDF